MTSGTIFFFWLGQKLETSVHETGIMCFAASRAPNSETGIINRVSGFGYLHLASDIWNSISRVFLMAYYMIIAAN